VRQISRLLFRVFCIGILNIATFGSSSPTYAQSEDDVDPDIKNSKPADPMNVPFDYAKPQEQFNFRQFVVKFHEGTGIRLSDGTLSATAVDQVRLGTLKLKQADIVADLTAIGQIRNRFKLTPLRHFGGSSEAAIEKRRQIAETLKGRSFPDLNLYFSFVRPATDIESAKAILASFRALKSVQSVYIQPIPQVADIPPTTTIDLRGSQGYKDPAPNGIDSVFASTRDGGRGADVRVIDVEFGWTLDHEDLGRHSFSHGFNFGEERHGTAVLGVMVALDNSYGVTGVVTDAEFGYSGTAGNGLNLFYSPAGAIDAASNDLRAGDVMLIEQQMAGPLGGRKCPNCCNKSTQFGLIAVEYWDAEFDAISIATANNINVIEAAGNGNMRLSWAIYDRRFDRNFRNSEAIIVGASRSGSRNPTCTSNRARRVDLHAWGQNVATLGYGGTTKEPDSALRASGDDAKQFYTRSFSGTSSATAIVASAVAALQGIVKAEGLPALSPAEMRDVLVNTGTPQATPIVRRIGVHPNLRAAIESLFPTPPPPPLDNADIVSLTLANGSNRSIDVAFTARNNGESTWSLDDAYSIDVVIRVDNVPNRTGNLLTSAVPPLGTVQKEVSIGCPGLNGGSATVSVNVRRNGMAFGRSMSRTIGCPGFD
jgi:serine protease